MSKDLIDTPYGKKSPELLCRAMDFLAANEDNARLIAAAPDLLAALQAVVAYWESPAHFMPSAVAEAARKAIAKATNA